VRSAVTMNSVLWLMIRLRLTISVDLLFVGGVAQIVVAKRRGRELGASSSPAKGVLCRSGRNSTPSEHGGRYGTAHPRQVVDNERFSF
jgi:hypothetical protein